MSKGKIPGTILIMIAILLYFYATQSFNTRMNEDVAELTRKLHDSGLAPNQADTFRGSILLMKGNILSLVTFMQESAVILILGILSFVYGKTCCTGKSKGE